MGGDLDFFKAITTRVSVEGRLQLCRGSSERMEALSNKITLRDCYNNTWEVEIAKDGGAWYFTEGWMQCYEANKLEFGDILLFEYKGNDMFHLKIFGSNNCDKERANCVDEKQEDEEDTETDCTYEINSNDSEYTEEESNNSYKINISEAENAEVESEDSEEESEEKEVYVPKKVRNSKAKCKAAQPGSSSGSVTQYGIESMPRRRRYRKRSGTDCYGSDIFRSGLISRPTNPFFVSRSRPVNRGNELNIPNEVIKDFKLRIPNEFHLVDEDGRKWGTKIRQWSDGRLWCIRGWDTLCRVNGIENDDVCICEIVQGENQVAFCIKVTALRN